MKAIFRFSLVEVATLLLVTHPLLAASSHTLHICHRGFCYNKREEPLSPSTWHLAQLSPRKSKNPSMTRGIDFCTFSEGEEFLDCELFSILGAESVDREFEALECLKGVDCGIKEKHKAQKEEESITTYTVIDGEVIELDEEIKGGHVSWKEHPQKGKCYDSELGYEFECNLVEVIE